MAVDDLETQGVKTTAGMMFSRNNPASTPDPLTEFWRYTLYYMRIKWQKQKRRANMFIFSSTCQYKFHFLHLKSSTKLTLQFHWNSSHQSDRMKTSKYLTCKIWNVLSVQEIRKQEQRVGRTNKLTFSPYNLDPLRPTIFEMYFLERQCFKSRLKCNFKSCQLTLSQHWFL